MLEDPRDPRGRLHTLSDVLTIVVLSVLCGCDNAEEFEAWGQDACMVRTRNAAHNLAVIRHFAFNLLRRCHDKHSLRMRQRRCDWDPRYRE